MSGFLARAEFLHASLQTLSAFGFCCLALLGTIYHLEPAFYLFKPCGMQITHHSSCFSSGGIKVAVTQQAASSSIPLVKQA